MTDADIGFLPATELVALYRAKSLSPVEAVDAVLRHIERQEPSLNATVLLTVATAREGARQRIFGTGGSVVAAVASGALTPGGSWDRRPRTGRPPQN